MQIQMRGLCFNNTEELVKEWEEVKGQSSCSTVASVMLNLGMCASKNESITDSITHYRQPHTHFFNPRSLLLNDIEKHG